MSALRYWDELEKEKGEEEVLEDIFDGAYIELIEACKMGKVKDDNAVIGAILSLVEKVFPKILEAYKDDSDEYNSRCLATATALRVTISSFMPISKFMDIMHKPEMAAIDDIVDDMLENGHSIQKEDYLVNIFKGMKPDNSKIKDPEIYG